MNFSRIWGCTAIITLAVLMSGFPTQPAQSADRSWIGGHGVWSNAPFWAPLGVPQTTDVAHIGNVGGAQGWQVLLDQDDSVAGLNITNSRGLDTNGHRLSVGGDTLVSGSGSLLAIERGVGSDDFDTGNLTIQDVGMVRLDFGGILDVSNLLTVQSDAVLAANGRVRLFKNGGRALQLDGDFWTGSNMIVDQLGSGLLDLDGIGGDSQLTVASSGTMTINGTELYDDFNGQINIGRESSLHMNMSAGWRVAPGGRVRFTAGFTAPGPGSGQHLYGGHLTVAGEVFTADNNSYARIHADTTFSPTAEVNVYTTSVLDIQGDSTIDGGSYATSLHGFLGFHGATTIHGGSFTSFNGSIEDGGTVFHGPTTWSGSVSIQGIVAQAGNAVVQSATTIQGDVFDMDGPGDANWQINAPLTLQLDAIDEGNNNFQGNVSISGSLLNQLNVQLSNPDDVWRMAGELNMSGSALFPIYRVTGNPVELAGEVHVDSRVGIAADTTFAGGNQTHFANPDSELLMNAATYIDSGSVFQGAGALINSQQGTMRLADGALVNVDFHNAGVVDILAIGQAAMKRFSQSANGELSLTLAGTVAGTEHDQLVSFQQVHLAGSLALTAIQPSYEDPQVAGSVDEFTLITASFVIGEFDLVEYNDVLLDWEFADSDGYRSHEGDGLFRILDYANTAVAWMNYRALGGDANGDGVVDGQDFTIWNSNKFTAGTDWTTGDFNGDGITDGQDFTIWNSNKFTSVDFSARMVPEPSAVTLTLLALAILVTYGHSDWRR